MFGSSNSACQTVFARSALQVLEVHVGGLLPAVKFPTLKSSGPSMSYCACENMYLTNRKHCKPDIFNSPPPLRYYARSCLPNY